MGKYSKLIAAIGGNVVAIIVAVMAFKGLATCSTPTDMSTCTIGGMSQAQITGGLMFIVNAIAVHQAPPNGPTS